MSRRMSGALVALALPVALVMGGCAVSSSRTDGVIADGDDPKDQVEEDATWDDDSTTRVATGSGSTESVALDDGCDIDVDEAELISGMDEIIESIECVYWAGYMTSADAPEAQCEGVLSDLRMFDPDVVLLKMKTRDGETVAECR